MYSSSDNSVSTTAVVAGASLAAIGILVPKLREVRFGPGGFEAKVGEEDTGEHPALHGATPAALADRPLPPKLLKCDPEALNRFAHLVSSDRQQAREAVEDALATVQVSSRRMAAEARAALTLRTLIELLDTADERRFLRGRIGTSRSSGIGEDDGDHEILQALQELDFYPRVGFVLAGEWGLRPAVIATLLGQPPELVELDLRRARELMGPRVEAVAGRSHA